jgi:hypothetical protein
MVVAPGIRVGNPSKFNMKVVLKHGFSADTAIKLAIPAAAGRAAGNGDR